MNAHHGFSRADLVALILALVQFGAIYYLVWMF